MRRGAAGEHFRSNGDTAVTSRPAPPNVVPLVHDGVRYEPDSSFSAGTDRTCTGGLAAFDLASGTRLWSVPLWTISDEPGAPPHPGRHVGRISAGPGPDDILVEDEHGDRFVVDRVLLTVRTMPRTIGAKKLER